QLPAVPFVIGFLRAYAQYCAMDPEAVLTAYRSLHRAPEPDEVVQRPVATPAPSPPRRHLVRLAVFLAVFGLLAGLVVHELRRGQQARSTVVSFPAGLPGMAEGAEAAGPSVVPVVPRPEPGRAALGGVQPAPAAA